MKINNQYSRASKSFWKKAQKLFIYESFWKKMQKLFIYKSFWKKLQKLLYFERRLYILIIINT